MIETKKCIKCHETKPVSEFNKHSNPKYKYQYKCRECGKAYLKEWYLKNKSSHLLKNKQWRVEHEEYLKEYKKKSHKIWSMFNQDNNNARAAKRRALLKQQTPLWGNDFFIKEIYHLAVLRNKHTNIKWHVDHIVPLNSPFVCGLHVEANLQIIPAIENIRKKNYFQI